MQSFYQRLKDQVVSNGRSPDDCAIFPAIEVIVGDSEAEAEEHADYLDSLATPEMGLTILSAIMNRDLAGISLDTPLDQVDVGSKGPSGVGAYENLIGKFAKSGSMPTLGEAAILGATTWWSPRLVGSAKQVADHLQGLFESRCCDGFIITQALSPGGIARFVELVVPELQARGIYRERYWGKTFRENLRSGN
jgi:alkanesulfonate monooxygenase SsuD/methylene tetrahydromethanopterin reductase-like flavin-dependent oxidoreductase (luciferase family)